MIIPKLVSIKNPEHEEDPNFGLFIPDYPGITPVNERKFQPYKFERSVKDSDRTKLMTGFIGRSYTFIPIDWDKDQYNNPSSWASHHVSPDHARWVFDTIAYVFEMNEVFKIRHSGINAARMVRAFYTLPVGARFSLMHQFYIEYNQEKITVDGERFDSPLISGARLSNYRTTSPIIIEGINSMSWTTMTFNKSTK